MSGGYVYVIEFCNGTVKVGHTQSLANRMRAHKQAARNFGLTVARCWESPCHDGFKQNEDALKRLARELGGAPTTAEFFNGVSYDALVEKAAGLPFPDPVPDPPQAVAEAGAPQDARVHDALIRQVALREHAKKEDWKATVAFRLLDIGVTPEFIRRADIPSLADHMELMLDEEAKVLEYLGLPPIQRPVPRSQRL